jgi:hypothetical protein
MMSSLESLRETVPAAHTAGTSRYSSSCCSRCSRRWILLSILRVAFSCSRRCAVRVAAWARGVGGSDREASTVTLY